VISRTSTQRFKSAPNDLRQIAQQLGVANILEGSVQKANDQVRVNVQLINAPTDAHLWADTYDRKLTDIFAVETEIAKAVADVLQAKLTGSEQRVIAARPTENTEAHQLYLKGRFFWNKRTGNDLKKSIDYFEQALAADPSYALGYAGVADAYVFLPGYTAGAPGDYYPKAKAAAKKALELDETLAEAHTTLALAIWYYDFDFKQANREFLHRNREFWRDIRETTTAIVGNELGLRRVPLYRPQCAYGPARVSFARPIRMAESPRR